MTTLNATSQADILSQLESDVDKVVSPWADNSQRLPPRCSRMQFDNYVNR